VPELSTWKLVPVDKVSFEPRNMAVRIRLDGKATVTGLAYLWADLPVQERLGLPIYGEKFDLPAAPFKHHFSAGKQARRSRSKRPHRPRPS